MQPGLQNPARPGQHRDYAPFFPKMEAVVYQLALQAVNLPERARTPSVSPSFSMGR